MNGNAREETIEVSVEDIQYITDDGAFSVVRVGRTRPSPDAPEFVAVGDLGHVARGEVLRLRGRFTTHKKYGKRFQEFKGARIEVTGCGVP